MSRTSHNPNGEINRRITRALNGGYLTLKEIVLLAHCSYTAARDYIVEVREVAPQLLKRAKLQGKSYIYFLPARNAAIACAIADGGEPAKRIITKEAHIFRGEPVEVTHWIPDAFGRVRVYCPTTKSYANVRIEDTIRARGRKNG